MVLISSVFPFVFDALTFQIIFSPINTGDDEKDQQKHPSHVGITRERAELRFLDADSEGGSQLQRNVDQG